MPADSSGFPQYSPYHFLVCSIKPVFKEIGLGKAHEVCSRKNVECPCGKGQFCEVLYPVVRADLFFMMHSLEVDDKELFILWPDEKMDQIKILVVKSPVVKIPRHGSKISYQPPFPCYLIAAQRGEEMPWKIGLELLDVLYSLCQCQRAMGQPHSLLISEGNRNHRVESELIKERHIFPFISCVFIPYSLTQGFNHMFPGPEMSLKVEGFVFQLQSDNRTQR